MRKNTKNLDILVKVLFTDNNLMCFVANPTTNKIILRKMFKMMAKGF